MKTQMKSHASGQQTWVSKADVQIRVQSFESATDEIMAKPNQGDLKGSKDLLCWGLRSNMALTVYSAKQWFRYA